MTIRKKPKRRTTISHEMLDVLAKDIKRRRHKVAVARAMLGITVHEPDTGVPIARLNPVPGTDKFTVLEEAGPYISANDEFWIELE